MHHIIPNFILPFCLQPHFPLPRGGQFHLTRPCHSVKRTHDHIDMLPSLLPNHPDRFQRHDALVATWRIYPTQPLAPPCPLPSALCPLPSDPCPLTPAL
jgi:hypothetical protein